MNTDSEISLGDRMKMYESSESKSLNMELPILVRLDGRHFHTFTRGLNRPFDERLSECMYSATKAVLAETNGVIGYTQSDEITIVILPTSQMLFSGRIQKLCSSLAALASVVFMKKASELLPPKYADKLPTFDCRVWNVPNLMEAANAVLWRELDAEKNSIASLAQSLFSTKELHGAHGGLMKEMVLEKGKSWDNLPVHFQRGIYCKKITTNGPLSVKELSLLPPKHHAHSNPEMIVSRSRIERVEFPRLISITNKVDLLFN